MTGGGGGWGCSEGLAMLRHLSTQGRRGIHQGFMFEEKFCCNESPVFTPNPGRGLAKGF